MLPNPSTMVPHRAPESAYARLLLYGIRRLAAGGLADAHAAHAFVAGFGIGFRRPLVMLRAFMAEATRVSTVKLVVAPCCCGRMTNDEQVLIEAVTVAIDDPARTHARLSALLHVRSCLGVVTSAQAVASSFADQGMPLGA